MTKGAGNGSSKEVGEERQGQRAANGRKYSDILYAVEDEVAWVTSTGRACSMPSASRR
jgi:hypothetical protein